MTINGTNYRLTKHGRRRYIERKAVRPDNEIIRDCVADPRAIWKPDRHEGQRLVTYLA